MSNQEQDGSDLGWEHVTRMRGVWSTITVRVDEQCLKARVRMLELGRNAST